MPDLQAAVESHVKIGRLMRDLQRRFFKGDRSTDLLRHAKDAEKRFDRSLDDLDAAAKGQQTTLFD